MKTIKFHLLALLFFCQFIGIAQETSDCNPKSSAFGFGESADYTIYYNLGSMWVSAGSVNFTVDSMRIRSKKYYHIISEGQTFKKYDWVYKVRDKYEVVAEVETFRSIRFKRDVNEGRTEIYEDYVFNHKTNQVVTLRKENRKAELVKDTVPFSACSFDVLSMIYVARNIDYSNLKNGDVLPITLFLDNEEHESYIRYLGKENITAEGLGTYRCIKFKPLLIEGTIFNAGEDMTVWVTDDEAKVPLLIDTPILVGSIKARLNAISGNKHKLTSKIRD